MTGGWAASGSGAGSGAAAGSTSALGRSVRDDLGGVESIGTVLGLARGTLTPGAGQEEIAGLLDARERSCEDVAQAYLARTDALNEDLNVFLHVDPERTLADAARLDAAGPTGLLPEEYDPVSERSLGNHPQAYSHVGLIRCAQRLSEGVTPSTSQWTYRGPTEEETRR